MREIEFRGLRKDGKGWAYGVPFHIYEEGKCFMINLCQGSTMEQEDAYFQGLEVVPSTVGQYTGMKDNKGTKIFEGDRFHLGDPKITYTVVFLHSAFYGQQARNRSLVGLFHLDERIMLIGNIHEGGEK